MKHILRVGFVCAFLAGCGGGVADEASSATTTTTLPSTTTTVSVTTTTVPSTTTTAPVTTTTTDALAQSAVVIDEVETEDGWRFQVAIIPRGANPEASPAGCIDVAPPGQTNLTFDVLIINLIDDRSAPNPQFVLSSNLIGDGTVAASDPFAEETYQARGVGAVVEVIPDEAGTRCLLAIGPDIGAQSIDPGGVFTFQATFGPIDESAIDKFEGGIRVFPELGRAIEAFFGTQAGSGEVLGERDLIDGTIDP